MQGSIFAAASIVSRIIGLVYRIPMQRIIGDVGMDFYSSAFEVYSILLIISSYSLPTAVSKLVSARMERGHRRNAFRLLRGAFLFAFLTGGTAGLVVWFGAKFITREILSTPLAVFSLKVLAPCLLITAVLGVIRGYFQGLGTMVPTAVSQIVEQIVNAVVSVAASYYLVSYGRRLGRVLGDPDRIGSAYGAVGGTLGTVSGAAAGFLFILFLYFLYRSVLIRQVRKDKTARVESAGRICAVLLLTVVPVLLSSTIYNISSFLDTGIFKKLALGQGIDPGEISVWWGKYTGKYKLLINVPISIASALAASSVPALSASFARRDAGRIQGQIDSAIRFSMVIALPCTVGMGVLAKPILTLLFRDNTDLAANMLRFGCIAIAFYSLSTLSNGILQGINRLSVPVINAVLALGLHLVALVLLVSVFHLRIYAVIWANVIYALLMCVFNQIGIHRATGYRMDFLGVLLKPALASCLMGVVVFGVYFGLSLLLGNTIATALSIVVGIFVYFLFLLLFKTMREEELQRFPGGRYLVRLGRMMHLL